MERLSERFCLVCKKAFMARDAEINRGRAKLCSRECLKVWPCIPVEERFWANVNKAGTCWLWTGGTIVKGYGQISRVVGGIKKNVLVHRLSWELHHGRPTPDDMLVCHKCDTPLCVNPDHLFLGTAKDNAHDMISKGRNVVAIGERHGMSKLTEKQVVEGRRLHDAGEKSIKELASENGVSYHSMYAACTRRKWQHIP